jgi:hypothetical protein
MPYHTIQSYSFWASTQKNIKKGYNKDTCIAMFITVLFTTAKGVLLNPTEE